MKEINPNNKTEGENYKLLTGSVIPRPIAFVTTKGSNGVINGAPFSYFNIVTAKPPLISLSIQRKQGEEMKDTARNILDRKEFVLHIVDEDNLVEVNRSAANLPADKSELETMNVTLVNSSLIKTPGMKEAKIRYECILEKNLSIKNDDNHIVADLIIGRIVRYHIANDIYVEENKISSENLRAVSRLAGHDYATVGKIKTIERPQ